MHVNLEHICVNTLSTCSQNYQWLPSSFPPCTLLLTCSARPEPYTGATSKKLMPWWKASCTVAMAVPSSMPWQQHSR
jgi:hypothetical protein